MENEIFVVTLALLFVCLLWWGFKVLPDERWQIMATVPVRKIDSERWDGVNLTYYGVFSANAYLVSVAMMLVLFGAIKVDIKAAFALVLIMMAFCLPMARIIAMIVEKKAHTRTVGGAVFAGTLVAPLAISIVNRIMGPSISIPIMPAMAALAISYSYGEGMGRLACISFGCCYGKQLSQCAPFLQTLFGKRNFIFSGKTKKIAYESGLDGEHVVPVQAVTSVLVYSNRYHLHVSFPQHPLCRFLPGFRAGHPGMEIRLRNIPGRSPWRRPYFRLSNYGNCGDHLFVHSMEMVP